MNPVAPRGDDPAGDSIPGCLSNVGSGMNEGTRRWPVHCHCAVGGGLRGCPGFTAFKNDGSRSQVSIQITFMPRDR